MTGPYRTCSRCVMDTSDPDITFDDAGVCNHCHRHDQRIREIPAGQPDATGRYPEGTINGAVQRTLDDLVSRIRPFMTPESGKSTQPGR